MKIKAINRSASECTRERSQDVQKVHKNLDPALHPFEKAVEYTRALNAAKLDRCKYLWDGVWSWVLCGKYEEQSSCVLGCSDFRQHALNLTELVAVAQGLCKAIHISLSS